MPELTFAVEGAAPVPFAAVPTIAFRLRIANAVRNEHIQNVLLTCQIQIETPRRRYTPEEQRRLVDLFGEPSRWSQTLRTMLWTHANRHGASLRRRNAGRAARSLHVRFQCCGNKVLLRTRRRRSAR